MVLVQEEEAQGEGGGEGEHGQQEGLTRERGWHLEEGISRDTVMGSFMHGRSFQLPMVSSVRKYETIGNLKLQNNE